MSRRILSICLVLGSLALTLFFLRPGIANAQTTTPTPSCDNPTYTGHVYDAVTGLGISGATVAASLDVPRGYAATTDASGAYSLTVPSGYGCHVTGLTATAAGYNMLSKGASLVNPNDFSLTKLGTPTPTITPTPTGTVDSSLPDLTISSLTYAGSNPPCANRPQDSAVVRNIGSSTAGTFVVAFSVGGTALTPQTVNGLATGQSVTLYFSAGMNVTVTADSTGVIAEANESNNTMTANLPIPTLAATCTPTGGPSLTPTRTPTGPTLTRTRTPTTGPFLSPTRTPTLTPTTGPKLCAPTATIAAPFTQDGAGAYCWQSTNLGTYINSWNLSGLTVNYTNYTNLYVAAASLPVKINGYWYVSYSSAVSYGHFEAK